MSQASTVSYQSGANYWLGLLGPLLTHGVLLESDERTVVYANDAFTRLFCIPIPPKSLMGMSCALLAERAKADFVAPEKFVADIEAQIRLRSEVRGHELQMKDGRMLLRHYRSIALPDGNAGHLWEFEEVTQQRLIEARLQQSDVRLRHIIESAQDGIICLDAQGCVIEWNPQAERMFGWPKVEAIGRPLTELIIPSEQHEAHRRGLARFLSTGESQILQRRRVELLAVRRDGSRVSVELSIAVIGAGQQVQFSGFVRDISAQKLAEENLHREVQFNSLLAQIAQHLNQSGSLTEVVATSLHAFRKCRPELVVGFYFGKRDERCFIREASSVPEGVPALPERLEASEATELLGEFARRWTATARYPVRQCLPLEAEGDSVGCLVICEPEICVPWSATQIQAICASLTLGIKRKRNVSELRSLAAAIDAALEGIAILDAEGRYIYMNPSHAHLFGYENPRELIGKTWRTVYRPEAIREFEVDVFPKLAKDGYWHGFPTGLKKDGTDVPEEVSLTMLPDGGLICVCMDNSERLNALESLRAANASLERSARFKDEVLANMSHELRTPLNAVIGMAESLQLRVYGELAPRQSRSVEVILSSARHLLDLINDILDLAKIEAGKLEVQKHEVNLAKLVEACLCMVREVAAAKRQRLLIHIPDRLPPLHTDGRRLKQILVNLLDNAIKFTPEGHAVGLEVCRAESTRQTLITVWDEGIGIPAAKQDQLFRPFVQLDTGFARRFEGTGLGLALVHRLSQLLGGTVRLISQESRGSRFTLILPDDLAETQPSGSEPAQHGMSPSMPVPVRRDRNPQVLLVEDNAPNAEMLKTFLLAVGYRVIHVDNGATALQEAARVRPEVILMDIQMPEMDGWETTRRLKSNPATADIPVLAVTALAMPEDRARCVMAGVDDYFAKPLKLRELAAALEKWIPKLPTTKP